MSFRCELEILEGENLPTSYRGGRPDGFVKIQFKQHDITHHTKIVAASQEPAWCERFVVDGVNESERVQLTMFDRDDAADSFIGSAEIILGGPTRRVGSKWVVLPSSPLQTAIRILWKVTPLSSETRTDEEKMKARLEEGRNTQKRTDVVEKIAMAAISETVSSVSATGMSSSSKGGESSTATGSDPNLIRHHVEAIEKLTATLELFMKQTERKFTAIEERLSDVEGLFRSRRNQLNSEATSTSSSRGTRFLYGSNDVTSTSTAQALSGTTASNNRITSPFKSKDDKNRTALDNIFVNPTQTSAEDDKLRVAYSLPSVRLPKSTAPSAAAALAEGTGGGVTTERNMTIKALNLDHDSKSLTRTV